MRSRFGALARLSLLTLLSVGLGGGVGACSTQTQLIVVVDTDLAIPSQLDAVQITVAGPSGMMESERATLLDRSPMPLTLAVVPSGEELGPILITATGSRGAASVVTRVHRVTLIRGETRMIVMHLAASCVGPSAPACSSTQTCTEGGCRAVTVDPATLPTWDGTPPSLRDAGPMPDVGRTDAGRTDAGDAGGDAGPPPCGTAADCDDGNPCTDDVCTATGCSSSDNAAACDDDVFCNGLDTCSGGTCGMHVGNPCGGATTCTESMGGRCEGCLSDADCPMPMIGAFGACEFADSCAISGTHSRINRRFSCTAGSCIPADVPESASCSRASTDGLMCASRSCGPEGACGGFSDSCDESGEATRSCAEGRCTGGTCATIPSTETVGCGRSTGGNACGPGSSCSGWSSCGGFAEPCGTSGTQSRTCQDGGSCSGGSCNVPAPRGESQGCGRGTDGVSCGGDVCSDWTSCSYAGQCDTGGMRSRTCQRQVCSGGGCGLGGAYGESDTSGCGRATDGWGCDDGDYCTDSDYCSGGYCYGGTYWCGGS